MADRFQTHGKSDREIISRSRSPRRNFYRPRSSHRSRSRSPRIRQPEAHRVRSPHRHHHKRKHEAVEDAAPMVLPYNSRLLTKRDYAVFEPMFALYLDIQKGKILQDLDEIEVKGRWKSFIGKWNRGELSNGWYDPSTLQKALQSTSGPSVDAPPIERPWSKSKSANAPSKAPAGRQAEEEDSDSDSDSDDSVGPTLPGQESKSRGSRMGPSIPNMQDLELKKEMEAEDGLQYRDDIRFARKVDRKAQKEALNELVPRAEAGTRERQLEKKKEVNEKMRPFREKSPGAVEVPDTELMGGGDGIEGYKKQKQEFERKKNERELRKEEILRARMAEREERLQEYRQKEEGTMAMLKQLAKQRFG